MFFLSCVFVPLCGSPAGKGLTSWLSFVVYNCEFVTFPLISGVIVSIPDLCTLTLSCGPVSLWHKLLVGR